MKREALDCCNCVLQGCRNVTFGLAESFFIFVTDRGPNEVYARKLWQIAQDAPEAVVLSSDCLEHVGHLVSFAGLKLADELLKQPFRASDSDIFLEIPPCPCNDNDFHSPQGLKT